MDWKKRSRQLHFMLLLRQNSTTISLLMGWFVVNFLILVALGKGPGQALLILFFFVNDNDMWGTWYQNMSDFVIFGLVVGVVMTDMQRRYRPEVTCRMLAQEMHDHAVIVEFTHLGSRVFELLDGHQLPIVVLEPDRTRVEHLIRQERPLVLGNGRERPDLDAASVRGAKLVVLAGDDLESVSVVASHVRELNPDCGLIVRCFEDDISEVLSKRYKAVIVSTSRLAAEYIKDYASKRNVKQCLLIGGGSMGRRLIEVMKQLNAEYRMVEPDRSQVVDLMDTEPILIGNPADPELLAEAHVNKVDLVVITEDNLSKSLPIIDRVRDVNSGCAIVCRVFHDDAADMITREPFRCDVISTSRYAVESLARHGAFQAVGLAAGTALQWASVREVQEPEG